MDTTKIIAQLQLDTSDYEASLQRILRETGNANFSKSVIEQNRELEKSAALYIELNRATQRHDQIQKDLERVRGKNLELERSLTKELQEEEELIRDITTAYQRFGGESTRAFRQADAASEKATSSIRRVDTETKKATRSGISFASVLSSGIGTALGISLESIVQSLKDFVIEGTQAAIASEDLAEGQQSTNEKIDRFNDILASAQRNVGQFLLPIFRDLLSVVDSLASGLDQLINPLEAATNEYREQGIAVQNLEQNVTPLLRRYEELRERTNLSAQEQEELRGVIERIGAQVPTAVSSFDEYGKVLDISAEATKEFIVQQQELLRAINANAIQEQEREIQFLEQRIRQVTALIQSGSGTGFNIASPEDAAENRRILGELNTRLDAARERVRQLSGDFDDFLAANPAESDRVDGITRTVAETQRIIADTVAFLRQQVSELEQELEFVIKIDDVESRIEISNQIAGINAQIREIEQIGNIGFAPRLTDVLDTIEERISFLENVEIPEIIQSGQLENLAVAQSELDNLNRRVAELSEEVIDPIEVDVRLNVPDSEQVVEAVEATSDEIEKRLAARNLQIISLEELTENLQTANDITSLALNSIGGLFDTLAQNRIDSENLSDTEIAEIRRRQFEREKAFAATSAVLQGSLTVLKFAAQLGPIGAAAAALLVGIQTAAILAQEPPAFRDGVLDFNPDGTKSVINIPGKGHRTEDRILASVSAGESYMTGDDTIRGRPALEFIRDGNRLNQYALGDQTYFAPKPLAPVQMPATLRTDVVARRQSAMDSLDYEKLASMVAKKVGRQNESAMHRFNEFKERKGFSYGHEQDDILLQILNELRRR